MNNYATTRLEHLLSPDQLSLVLKSTKFISELPDVVRLGAVEILVNSYNERMKTIIGFTAAQFIGLSMVWRNPQILISNTEGQHEGRSTGVTESCRIG